MAASSIDWLADVVASEPRPRPETRHCESHGPYEARHQIGLAYLSRCPVCDAAAHAAAEARAAARAAAEAAEKRQKRLDASGLRGRYLEAGFENFSAETEPQRKVLAAVREFAEDPSGSLILIGPCGVGKSHLLASLTRNFIEQRSRLAVCLTVSELIRQIRATWHRDSEVTENETIDRLGELELLALDDVGAGLSTPSEQAILLAVVDRRYQLRRPTAISTNLGLPALKAAVGERFFDRLRESAQVLALNWPSYRGRT